MDMMAANGQRKQRIAYTIMKGVMNVRKRFRNIDSEVNLAEPQDTDIVVDYGCGPGFNTIHLAKDLVRNGQVYALDNNPNAIKDIAQKSEELNLKNIKTIVAEFPEGVEDESVDIVFLHNVFPYIQDKETTLSEIYRILKPEGRLSYMSRRMSHIMGRRETGEIAMTDAELTRHLETSYNFELIQRANGHLIFEKVCKAER
jgi:ubiquinone/menaquinone biosynthesis C-methylase UbiE